MRTFDDIVALEEIEYGRYLGARSPDRAERMFGGLFLAQAMEAASKTSSLDRSIHSLHCYFLRPGDTTQRVEYQVTEIRDGRSYSHRQVIAYQEGKELFWMVCSYAIPGQHHEYIGCTMPEVPLADQVDYTYEAFCRDQMPDPNYIRDVKNRPFDIRYINPPSSLLKQSRIENQLMWMRLTAEVSDNPLIHDAGVAFLSDSTLIDHVTIPHGKRWRDADFEGTSLDHAMWFHQTPRADEWLLFDQKVEWTGDGRGLASGRIFTAHGTLVATCMQEGLMRFTQ